jgi:hypothetical protein
LLRAPLIGGRFVIDDTVAVVVEAVADFGDRRHRAVAASPSHRAALLRARLALTDAFGADGPV